MNTVLFVNATIGFSENLFLVIGVLKGFKCPFIPAKVFLHVCLLQLTERCKFVTIQEKQTPG